MHSMQKFCAGALVACVAFSAAGTAKPQTSAATTGVATTNDIGAHRICFDRVYYGPMPGVTDYCLGLRQWERGNYSDGLELLKLSAGWGNKSAQYTLGLIHYNGHHVPVDRALGLAWLQLADQRNNDAQIHHVAVAAAKWATPAERKQAAQLYQSMLGTYGDKVAAARAWHHLRHWQRRRGRNSGLICVNGRQAWALNHAGLTGSASTVVTRAMAAAHASAEQRRSHGMGSHVTSGDDSGACVGVSFALQNRMVDRLAATYFSGWMGTVSVGPLTQVPASAASTQP